MLLRIVDRGDESGVSAVTVAEFFAGLPPERRPRRVAVLSTLEYRDITFAASRRAGARVHDYRRRGITLATADTLTAAVAVGAGATLLTGTSPGSPAL
jgi:predicted nucleic acid-binding protein